MSNFDWCWVKQFGLFWDVRIRFLVRFGWQTLLDKKTDFFYVYVARFGVRVRCSGIKNNSALLENLRIQIYPHRNRRNFKFAQSLKFQICVPRKRQNSNSRGYIKRLKIQSLGNWDPATLIIRDLGSGLDN